MEALCMSSGDSPKDLSYADATCPCCGAKKLFVFYQAQDVPVACTSVFASRKEALGIPRGDIVLGFCLTCGFISNIAFDPMKLDNGGVYEDQQGFSPAFRAYADNLAKYLIDKYHLYNKDIVEIGCGDGDFLEMLCRIGDNRCFGFDPSRVPDLDKTGGNKRITFIRDYYSDRYSHYRADLLCCRHVLEHVEDPEAFFHEISRVGQAGYIETPSVIWELLLITCATAGQLFWPRILPGSVCRHRAICPTLLFERERRVQPVLC